MPKFKVSSTFKGSLGLEEIGLVLTASEEIEIKQSDLSFNSVKNAIMMGFLVSLDKDFSARDEYIEFVNLQNSMVGSEGTSIIVGPHGRFTLSKDMAKESHIKDAIKNNIIKIYSQKEANDSLNKRIKKRGKRSPVKVKKEENEELKENNTIFNNSIDKEDDSLIFVDKKQEKERIEKLKKAISQNGKNK